MIPDPGDPTATLDEIRANANGSIIDSDEDCAEVRVSCLGHNALRLLAALDAVLEEADNFEADRPERLVPRSYAAECFRAAIIRVLTKEAGGDD